MQIAKVKMKNFGRDFLPSFPHVFGVVRLPLAMGEGAGILQSAI
jgi:hypothetical protein